MTTDRRAFLKFLGLGATSLALGGCASMSSSGASSATQPTVATGPKQMRGVFPIGQTPFTEADKIDLEALASEVRFCNRGGVHGFIWPQIASGWTNLSEQERLDGAEAILAAGKGGRTVLVIGVQSQDGSMATVERYAKHAVKNGADAIVSLPPPIVTDVK
jgi:dihydrodipicolinate synthase/N-acetylneuraminate lyase